MALIRIITPKVRKEVGLSVIKIFIISSLLLLAIACNSSKNLYNTYNKSKYTYEYLENHDPDRAISDSIDVTIELYDATSNKSIVNSIITIGCYKFQGKTGNATYSVRSSNDLEQIKISSIGYFSIETLPLHTNRGNILLKVYLTEDDRIIMNCEGSSYKIC